MDASGYVPNWYAYVPMKAPAIAATALFALTLIAHTWQMIRHKAWIWIVMVVAVASMFTAIALLPHLDRLRALTLKQWRSLVMEYG